MSKTRIARLASVAVVAMVVAQSASAAVETGRILIDLGHPSGQTAAGPDAWGQHWNNAVCPDGALNLAGTDLVSNALNAAGAATAIDFRMTSYWNPIYWTGLVSPAQAAVPAISNPLPSTGARPYQTCSGPTAYDPSTNVNAATAAAALHYPNAAIADANVVTVIAPAGTSDEKKWVYGHATYHLTDLDPNGLYTIKIFAGSADDRSSAFSVLGATGYTEQHINPKNNTGTLITFVDVAPDANNEIRINFRKSSSLSTGTNWWNVLEVDYTIVNPLLLGDVNGDLVVDGLDIQPFVDIITGAGGASASQLSELTTVPEPTTMALLGLCGLALVKRRRNWQH